MIQLFMITLGSSDSKNEHAILSEVLQKAYMGIETLANGYQNNFCKILSELPQNEVLLTKLDKLFLDSVSELLKTKFIVFEQLNEVDIISLDRYSLAGHPLKLKVNLLNLKLLRLEKEFTDYTQI
ncbi:MAG: hypothetical protein MH472_05865, partial [Bacteroidia bacterium]|nr:hypothetical protein [Bacteroidia bacterium]